MVFGTNPIVEAIMAYCDDNGYRTNLMNLRLYDKWQDTWYDDIEKLKMAVDPVIHEALSIRVSGIIYVAGHCRIINCIPPDLSIPVVIAYGLSKSEAYPSIIIDDEKGGYDIASHLITRGHKKIGVIAGAAYNMHTEHRLLGYQRALFDNGVTYNPSWVIHGDWKRESGHHGAAHLVKEGVTAIFCMNDDMAAGVYDYLYEQNIAVGRDISVAGYDNMEISDYLRPRLTTNEIQLNEIGRKSAEIMLNALEGEERSERSPHIYKVPCRLIERESVASV
jgi:LacI family transcriptional regulator